jgi:hypothetical protein
LIGIVYWLVAMKTEEKWPGSTTRVSALSLPRHQLVGWEGDHN